MRSLRPALLSAAFVAVMIPAAALACDAEPKGKGSPELPACEGASCSARTLLKGVDGLLRRTDRCRVDAPPATPSSAKKPALLEPLGGQRESTVLPAPARHEAG